MEAVDATESREGSNAQCLLAILEVLLDLRSHHVQEECHHGGPCDCNEY